jgi:CubicO group peptidase (beta-lactamase class C family)
LKSIILLLLSCLLFAFGYLAVVNAQTNQPAKDTFTEKVDKLFSQFDRPDSPGCAIAIIKDGQILYKRGYGMANLDHSIPLSSKSVFNIASVSKQFTTMSIALLAREGKISLDDDIRKYVPEIPQYGSPITIRHLIYHTSGIREYFHLQQLAGTPSEKIHTNQDILKLIARQKALNFIPGEEYVYTNSEYFLLAQIVERVSGKSLREYAEEKIFKPLGMINTHFHDDVTEIVPNRATGYAPRRNGGFSVVTANSKQVGAGGLYTTVEDLFLWIQNFYNNKLGGGQGLIDQFLSTGRLNNGDNLTYAFGVDVEKYKGLRMVSHGGFYFGFVSDLIWFPEQRFAVACLCNLSGVQAGALSRQVADIYLANDYKQDEAGKSQTADAGKVINISEAELTKVSGLYFNSRTNNMRRIYVKDGKLIYSRGSSESELAPLGNDQFRMLGVPFEAEISFKSPRLDAPLQMFTVVEGSKPFIHEQVQPAAYTPQQLALFAGTYQSEEVGETYTLTLKESKLILSRKGLDDTPLEPLYTDVFMTVGSGRINFKRNEQGQVSGFLLSTDRARNILFNKM